MNTTVSVRKAFATYLCGLSDEALRERQQRFQHDFKQARINGDCVLEAVLYFDCRQIEDELIQRRMKRGSRRIVDIEAASSNATGGQQ